jgi:hypothetical protein
MSAFGRDPSGSDDAVERGLKAAVPDPVEVQLGDALRRELAELRPVVPRSPRRQLLLLVVGSLAYVGIVGAIVGVRGDALGRLGLIGAGLVVFVALAWLAIVPRSGQVMPRARLAAALAGVAAAVLVAIGLASGDRAASSAPALAQGGVCLELGVLTAIVPVAVAALLVRGCAPVGGRWVAAALGVAGGALGCVLLELHCGRGDRLHLGLGHGGAALAAGLLSALIVSIVQQIRRRGAG